MDRELFDIAYSLQAKLSSISPESDRAALIWAHGFLCGVLDNLTSRVPELPDSRPLKNTPEPERERTISELQQETSRILDDIDRFNKDRRIRDLSRRALNKLGEMNLMNDERDSLERLLDDLDESGPAETSGVPANRRPSPKDLSGGVALPLPMDSDYKM